METEMEMAEMDQVELGQEHNAGHELIILASLYNDMKLDFLIGVITVM